jgi:thiamine-phosphate pyrophosphorylase
MHKNNLKKFYFIDQFNKDHLKNLNNNTAVIYRNYNIKYKESEIQKISNFCKSKRLKFFLSNDVKLAIKLRLNGVYIPSFNKSLNVLKAKLNNLTLLGSAHNIKEINEKKRQKVDFIFLTPIFKVKKRETNLGIIRFNILSKLNGFKSVALGGINFKNINKIKILNCYGFGSISYIKESLIKLNESNRNN